MKRTFILLFILVFAFRGYAHTITISSLEWPPFCGSEEGKKIHHDIVDLAFAKVEYTVIWKILPWKRATKYAEMGVVDAVGCLWYNEERAQMFHISESTGVANELVLFKRKSDNITFDGDFTKLRRYTFGTVSGFSYPDSFLNAGLKLDYVIDDKQNLKKILVGRIDLILNDKIQVLTLIKENMPDKLDQFEILKPSVRESILYVGFSRKVVDGVIFKKDFNKALHLIKTSGEIKAIKSRYGLK